MPIAMESAARRIRQELLPLSSRSSAKPKVENPPPMTKPCRTVLVVCHHGAFTVMTVLYRCMQVNASPVN